MVFNATFNQEYTEKTTDLPQVTDIQDMQNRLRLPIS